jgi:hypothetical protein
LIVILLKEVIMERIAPQPSAAEQATAADRRAFVRHPVSLPAKSHVVGVEDEEAWWSARVCDVSLGGVGMVMARRPEAGTRLEVEFQLSAGGGWYRRLARVMHATAQEGGGWLVGCEFVDQLRDEDLAQLLLDATDDFEKPGRS